ncbi:MAG: hypothetical protein O3A84_12590 [Proteobacteria bacterium]|nr:hypothetical protein [Pseudomonadota bacterium]
MRNHKTLVFVVLSLGIVIVILFGILGYGMVKRATDPNFSFFSAKPTPEATTPKNVRETLESVAAPAGDFGEVAVTPPAGATLKGYRIEKGRLVLRFERHDTDGLTSVFILIDLKSGAKVGTVTLGPGQ